MATSASSGGGQSQNFIGELHELWELVLAYVKQETVDPVKGLGRYVAWGLAGSLSISLAGILLVLGVLRLLQERTGSAFDGNWSFVPYVVVLLGCAAVAGLAIKAMTADRRERS